jgi:hypothetical protein
MVRDAGDRSDSFSSSRSPTRHLHMPAAACAASVGSTSASGWQECADHQFRSMRILGSCFGLRLSIQVHFAVEGRYDGQTRGFSMLKQLVAGAAGLALTPRGRRSRSSPGTGADRRTVQRRRCLELVHCQPGALPGRPPRSCPRAVRGDPHRHHQGAYRLHC